MKKRFKVRKKGFKKIFLIILIVFTIYFMMGILYNGKTINLKDLLFNSLLKEIIKEDSFISKRLDIEINTPENLIYTSLNKIVDKKDMTVFSSKEDDYFNYDDSKSDYVEDPSDIKSEDPIVYIYNSHQLEEYNMDVLYDYSIKPNVLIASYILKEKFIDIGISSIVETSNIKKYLNDNKLKYNYSYVASRYFAEIMMKKEPSIKYLIDIHRDSAKIDKTLYKFNNKEYARIMFVVGLDNVNYQPNLDLAINLNSKFKEKYSGFSRGVLKKSGKGVNGVYNQDLSPNAMLIEVGGVDNTIEQVNNSMDLLSEIIGSYIKEKINE